MKYDKLDLLELFESEPTILHGDEQAGGFMYSKTDTKGINLLLVFNVYEKKCEISICTDSGKQRVCYLVINSVSKLERKNESLFIISDDLQKARIDFKPNIVFTNEIM